MSIKIYGKGDIDLLSHFNEGDFEGYELHLGLLKGNENKSLEKLPPYINIAAIHNPTRIKIKKNIFKFDLNCGGKIEEKSWEDLKKTIHIAQEIGAEKVIIHGASHNPQKNNKKESIEEFVNKIKKWDKLISFENDALWRGNFPVRPLLATVNDFTMFKKVYGNGLKTTFDLEHSILTCCFEEFLKHNVNYKKTRMSWKEFNLDYQTFIAQNRKDIQIKITHYIEDFIKLLGKSINHLHVNGSDFTNFTYKEKGVTPLRGEHLDISENLNGIKDRNDYGKLAHLLTTFSPAALVMVLELMPDEYFRKRLLVSKNRLFKKLAIKERG